MLIEGWYATEPGCDVSDASGHFPPKTGDEFDTDICLLIREADVWYVKPYEAEHRLGFSIN